MIQRFLIATFAIAVATPAAVRVSSAFQGGSIGTVEAIAPDHYRCGVRGEVDQDGRNRQASWYHFRIDGAAGRKLVIDLVDLPGEYNYQPGNLAINSATRPFVSYDQSNWTPLPKNAIEWLESGPVLRLHLTPEKDSVWIAHVPPYTGSHLNRLLNELSHHPNAQVGEAGRSAKGRVIPVVTVTNAAVPASRKKVLWMMARQHAWESGTSWLMDGAIRSVLQKDASAARLRDEYIFKFFPMADPDGVERGGVRFNAHGFDVNRNWDTADPQRMPEITALRKTVLDWIDGGRRIDFFLSLHNTNNDYLEGPLSEAGPDYRETVKRFVSALGNDTIFNPKEPRDWTPGPIQRGRFDACQALFRDRAIPTMLLEQNVQTLSKLNRPAGIEDYRHFGAQVIAALAAAVATRGPNLLPDPAVASAWTVWTPRDSLKPRTAVTAGNDATQLSLEATSPGSFGKWLASTQQIQPGRSYRFDVWYHPVSVRSEDVSLPIILTWCSDAEATKMVQRDFVDTVASAGEWRRAMRTLVAPEKARSVRVELGLRWTAQGLVSWKDPRLEEVTARPHRIVRVATTHLVPPPKATMAANRDLMSKAFDEAGAKKPDVVLFSENFPDRGVRQPVGETAETIPGPTTEMLSRKAKQYATYAAASLHEREGALIYNTAVLIDRKGRLVGKYRKTHLAMIEGENGITPGNEYPVFATDFGKVGLLVCWDNWFSEPARILRLKGAELLLLPIAGDGSLEHWDAVSRVRAVDNGLYFVSSNTVGDSTSRIIDPSGKVLAETNAQFGIVSAEIDLDREQRLQWLSVGPGDGEARSLYIHERRPDTYGPLQ